MPLRWFLLIVLVLCLVARTINAVAAPNALLVGDSLAVGMQPYMHHTTTDARVGRSIAEGVRHFYEHPQPRLLYVSLGTNDSPESLGLLRSAIRRSKALVGSGCVVWSTLHRNGGYGRMNAVIRHAAGRHVMAVQWNSVVRRHPWMLAPDHIHLTPAGYKLRAHMYEKAGHACLDRKAAN
jgi:lysophospholipase L1-like esterase